MNPRKAKTAPAEAPSPESTPAVLPAPGTPRQALYRRWRPRDWDEVIGQDHIITTLRNAVTSGRVGHAFLFAGPRGTGKTTTARLLAKAINCTAADPARRPCGECQNCQSLNAGRFMDLIEIDAASNTSVDDVRDLREKMNFSPAQGQFKVYIIDEAHMLSKAAFNALLKTLEEPPPHAKFILATTEAQNIPATVLSRCQRFEFRRVRIDDIVALLKKQCQAEGLEVDDEALHLICRQAGGSFRDAISLLDQLTSTGQRVTPEETRKVLGTAAGENVTGLVSALLDQDIAAGLRAIHSTLESGADARQFARQVAEYLRSLLLVRSGNTELLDVSPEMVTQMQEHAGRFTTPQLLEAIRQFVATASDTRGAWQPGLGLELALAQAASFTQQTPPAAEPPPPPVPGRRVVAPPPSALQSASTQSASAQSASAQSASAQSASAQSATAHRTAAAEPQTPLTQRPPARVPPAGPVPAPTAEDPQRAAQAGETEMEILRQRWREIRAEVRKANPLTEAALNSSRRQAMVSGMLVLTYPNDLLMKKMATEENLALLFSAIRAVTGLEIQTRCVVAGTHATSDEDSGQTGGIVRTALDLGGKIIYKE